MAAAGVLQMLANSDTKLSDALRSALLLPEVQADGGLSRWINDELTGYREMGDDEVPEYRKHHLAVHGNASNGAWYHKNVVVPTHTFSAHIREFGSKKIILKHAVGGIESVLESGDGDPGIPWPAPIVSLLNSEIASGSTEIDDTYAFSEVWFQIPRNLVHQLLESVRQRALIEIAKRVPQDQLAARVNDALPAVPGTVAIKGSGNQVIVASPGASTSLTIEQGDRTALDEALASMGIAHERLDALHDILDDAGEDEPGRVIRALAWCRTGAKDLGINTVGAAAATLILQYLGLV